MFGLQFFLSSRSLFEGGGLGLNVDRGWCAARFRVVTIKAIVHKAEEGGYWAEVPALPGCVTQAETMDELRTNLREAIEGWLEAGSDSSDDPDSEILELAM